VVLSEEITGYSKNSQPSCLAYFFFTKEDEPDTQYGIELSVFCYPDSFHSPDRKAK
jgi:hypothetical protein